MFVCHFFKVAESHSEKTINLLTTNKQKIENVGKLT
jgi:hypothetical protein